MPRPESFRPESRTSFRRIVIVGPTPEESSLIVDAQKNDPNIVVVLFWGDKQNAVTSKPISPHDSLAGNPTEKERLVSYMNNSDGVIVRRKTFSDDNQPISPSIFLHDQTKEEVLEHVYESTHNPRARVTCYNENFETGKIIATFQTYPATLEIKTRGEFEESLLADAVSKAVIVTIEEPIEVEFSSS